MHQNPEACALLVQSHPSCFLYQFVSLELKHLESLLTPPSPPGKHPVSVPGTGPGNAPRTGPASPEGHVLFSPANFWPLWRLFKVIAVNSQNVWNILLTLINLSDSLPEVAAGSSSFLRMPFTRLCHYSGRLSATCATAFTHFKRLVVLASHIVFFEN